MCAVAILVMVGSVNGQCFIGLHASTLECPHPIADKPPIAVAAPVPDAWRDRYGGAIVGAATAQIKMFEMFKCDT